MALRNAEVAKAMGLVGGLLNRWRRDRNRAIERQVVASDRAATMTGTIRFVRMLVQSLILGLGAYLAVERLTTVGAMFAASILLGRAMQPVEQTVGQWRALVSARAAWARVRDLLIASPPHGHGLNLSRPRGQLVVEDLVALPKGRNRPVLRHVAFGLEPGQSLGIIGPSGAGKSTLARHLMGLIAPTSGAVRLDGADVWAWPHEQLGRYVGYLPQDVELFADTVAANIGRFRTDADEEVLEAARLAGVHDMILKLPNGYDTHVGDGGELLSGGYRQRIALARAVFGNPAFVLLDEPSSNLDAEGDQALTECVLRLKHRGTSVVIVSHRPATLSTVD
jgi:PrtD family type I secretion system ABC transporter